MNLLDRAIGWFSPAAGVRRAIQRHDLHEFRSYAAGRMDRQSQGWNPTGGSPDEVHRAAGTLLERRSADLVRNNPFISTALRRLPASIVGTGVTASVQGLGDRARKAVQEDWDIFREQGNALGTSSWDADLALLLRTVIEVGDALIVWESVRADEGMQVPLRWRMYPGSYLDRTRTHGAYVGNTIDRGVEINAEGKVVAFWIYERHPADTLHGLPVESRRVEAKHVDLVFEPLWLHQRRGVPWLAPVALAADELQQYDTAALWKARMAASYGLARKRSATAQSPMVGKKDEKGRKQHGLAPGMVLDLESGEDVSALTPPRDDNFEVFWKTRLYAMAAGIGMPHASLTGDLRQANYSSLREGKLLYWELLDVWQWNMVADKVLKSAWRRFAAARYAAGRTTGGVLPTVKWGFPKRAWTDPQKDVAALRDEMDLGLTTWPDAVASRGEDPSAQLVEITDWSEKLNAAGLPIGRGNVSREVAEASGKQPVQGAQASTDDAQQQ